MSLDKRKSKKCTGVLRTDLEEAFVRNTVRQIPHSSSTSRIVFPPYAALR